MSSAVLIKIHLIASLLATTGPADGEFVDRQKAIMNAAIDARIGETEIALGAILAPTGAPDCPTLLMWDVLPPTLSIAESARSASVQRRVEFPDAYYWCQGHRVDPLEEKHLNEIYEIAADYFASTELYRAKMFAEYISSGQARVDGLRIDDPKSPERQLAWERISRKVWRQLQDAVLNRYDAGVLELAPKGAWAASIQMIPIEMQRRHDAMVRKYSPVYGPPHYTY